MHQIEEGSGRFVVACCDGPVDLEASDHSLDVVALAINALVPADLRFAIGFGRVLAIHSIRCRRQNLEWDDGAIRGRVWLAVRRAARMALLS
jgi:hypothetical protein